MQRSLTKKLQRNSFWLSVLLHLLLLLFFTTVIIIQPKEKKPPHMYVPAYVYKGAITPAAQPQISPSSHSAKQQVQKKVPTQKQEPVISDKHGIRPKSILAATQEVLQEAQRNAIRASLNANQDPIYLVGDENEISDPLINMLGHAISAHFEYPRVAGELGIKGRVLVGVTLHPEGHFTDIQILKSSNNQDLDAAALYAINKAPNVTGADRFISAPKHFVVGFIFQ